MISLYAGRLKLDFDNDTRQWVAHVIVGPKPEQQTIHNLETVHLYTAQHSAVEFYRQFRAEHLPDRLTCWTCKQWSPTKNTCGVGVPECRKTGGKFAPNCALYCKIPD